MRPSNEYGMNQRGFVEVLCVSVVLGVITAISLYFWSTRPEYNLTAVVFVTLVLPVLLLPTVICKIVVHEDRIEHVALGRWRLSIKPREALESVQWGGLVNGLTLHFRDGSTIRHPGAYQREAERLSLDVLRRRL